MNTNKKRADRHYLFWVTFGVLVLGAAVVGALGGLIFGYAIDLPRVEDLQQIRPSIVTYVYSDDGRVLGQFALEKRMLITYEQLPPKVKQAILAIEDANFFQHPGIDFRRLFVTIAQDILYGKRKGASTLTMQLSKLRFTSNEKTIERKIKDMLYAIEIEKNYSKEQIFTFYCNQIYMGHGTYGIAAAADFYFHKPLDRLSLTESALLSGMIQAPERYSPINHPRRALRRRNNVLRRMHQEGYIDKPTFQNSVKEDLLVHGKNYERSPAAYFIEWVRQYLEQKYSTDKIWQEGLRVYTTADYDMQLAAHQAIQHGLKEFDHKTRRWEGPVRNVLDKSEDLESYSHPEWNQIFYEGQLVHGLVIQSDSKRAQMKLGSYTATITPQDMRWTGEKRVDRVLKSGDIVALIIEKIDQSEKSIKARLDRVPEVQGALLALENKTGAIKAMVGGFDFRYSQFNRATQALRQPGSIFKPFTYVAAMEAGYSPIDQILDAPASFRDTLGRVYAPMNWDSEFKGLITIREAFSLSRNIPTIRLANALGIENVIKVAHRFGINRNFPPYLSVALGAGEVTLDEITSAFTVFANNGVRVRPHFIKRVEDFNGLTLEEYRPQVEEVISFEVAGKMLSLLQSVVESGTASQAKKLKRPVAGKTGTTDASTDTWFAGFTPQLTAGVWTGYDQKRSLGEEVYGATLALPIWIDFMEKISEKFPLEDFPTTFTSPYPRITQKIQKTEEEEQTLKSGSILVEDITPPNFR